LLASATDGSLTKHLNHQPVPPSERSGVAIPAKLEQIVLSRLSQKRGELVESDEFC
jgi:hypothetical protein